MSVYYEPFKPFFQTSVHLGNQRVKLPFGLSLKTISLRIFILLGLIAIVVVSLVGAQGAETVLMDKNNRMKCAML